MYYVQSLCSALRARCTLCTVHYSTVHLSCALCLSPMHVRWPFADTPSGVQAELDDWHAWLETSDREAAMADSKADGGIPPTQVKVEQTEPAIAANQSAGNSVSASVNSGDATPQQVQVKVEQPDSAAASSVNTHTETQAERAKTIRPNTYVTDYTYPAPAESQPDVNRILESAAEARREIRIV